MKPQLILALVAFGVLLRGEGEAAASSLPDVSAWFADGASDVATVAFGCNVVNGQLVCGNKQGNNGDADDQGSQKKKNKHKADDTDSDSGLTQCTMQNIGCSVGFKHVCEKLKNGKKCCGCVPDKNASSTQSSTGTETPATTPAPTKICCGAAAVPAGADANTKGSISVCAATQAEAEQGVRDDATKDNVVIQSAISCQPAHQ
jgi:hypothetical protein